MAHGAWEFLSFLDPGAPPEQTPEVPPSPTLRLHADRGGTTLRWVADDQVSVRAYEIAAPSHDRSFCVSTTSSELTLVLEGELEISFGAARRTVVAGAGEGLLVLRGTPHTTKVTPGTRFVIVDVASVPSAELGVVALAAKDIPSLFEKRIPELWAQETTSPARALGSTVQTAVARALPRGLVPLEGSHSTLRMLAVKQHLENCYAHPVNLDSVASRFRMNRFYLVRAYTKNFGLSPMAYVQALRLEHFAWSLLRGAAKPMTELAGAAGFGDYSTFCRRVRQTFGRAPSELVARADARV